MVTGLKQDLGDAADQVGRAADYYKGSGDHAKGAKFQEWVDYAKETLAGRVAKSAAGAAGVGGVYSVWKWLTGK